MQVFRFLVVMLAAATMLGTADLAHGDVLITVNKATQRMTVAVDGVELYRWPVSTARPGYTTPNGVYRPIRLERSWFSKEYDDAPMPYAIFFQGGYAVHGSYEISKIGKPASHGCVRLNPANAEILFKLVKVASIYKTQVVIEGPDASAARMDVRPTYAASATHASDKSRRRLFHAISAKGSLPGRHVEQTTDDLNARAQSPRFVNPFAALFFDIRNRTASDKTQVTNKKPAVSVSRMDARQARIRRRHLDNGGTGTVRFRGAHVVNAPISRRRRVRYLRAYRKYAPYYGGRGLFTNGRFNF